MKDADGIRGSGCGCLILIVPLFVIFLVVDFLWGAQLGIYPTGDHGPPAIPNPTSTSTPTGMPALIDDPSQPDWMVEGSWYCWDAGEDRPHRLGHYVPGDHLCTWGELRSDGFAYQP
jgi:hypothetical protein